MNYEEATERLRECCSDPKAAEALEVILNPNDNQRGNTSEDTILCVYSNASESNLDAAAADLSPANLRRVAERLHDRAEVFFAWDGEFQAGDAETTPQAALAAARECLGDESYAEALEANVLSVGMFTEDALMLLQLADLLDAGVATDVAEHLALRGRWRLGSRLDEEVTLGFIALWDVSGDGELVTPTLEERLSQGARR